MTSKEALSALKKEIGSLNVLPAGSDFTSLRSKPANRERFVRLGREAGMVIIKEMEDAHTCDRRLSR